MVGVKGDRFDLSHPVHETEIDGLVQRFFSSLPDERRDIVREAVAHRYGEILKTFRGVPVTDYLHTQVSKAVKREIEDKPEMYL